MFGPAHRYRGRVSVVDQEGQYYNADGSEYDGSGGGLRRQLEAVIQENRALREDRENLIMQKAVADVSVALEKAGFQPGQAKFVPPEDAVDPARLEGWIKENGGLLARNAETDDTSDDGGDGSSNIDGERADAIRKMKALNSGGSNATVDMDALHARMSDPNLSEKEFDALVAPYRT